MNISKVIDERAVLDIINKITFKTIGCTEPIAIALAAVVAYKEIQGEIKSVKILLDKNVYKNAMAVGIPGTDQKGPKLAVALGLVCGDPDKGLLLLENTNESNFQAAKKILEKNLISIDVNTKATTLTIQAEIETDRGYAKAIISHCHDNIILIERNGKVIYHKITDTAGGTAFLGEYDFTNLQLNNLISTIEKISPQEIAFLNEGYILNKKAAEIGIAKYAGMGLGANFKKLIDEGILENNFINQTKMLVAGASDARMGGIKVPVYGCVGSGNHGIAFFLTIGNCLSHFQIEQNKQLYAYTFGLIILAAIKQRLGLLSSMCGGAVAIGAAAAAAITYALGGSVEQITNSVNLVIGNISGMVCDGGKCGCSLKIATGSFVAIESACMALNKAAISASDGIIGRNFIETIANLGLLNKQGMRNVEEIILEVLQKKTK